MHNTLLCNHRFLIYIKFGCLRKYKNPETFYELPQSFLIGKRSVVMTLDYHIDNVAKLNLKQQT